MATKKTLIHDRRGFVHIEDPEKIIRTDGSYGYIETLEEACAAAFRAAYRGLASQGWKLSYTALGAFGEMQPAYDCPDDPNVHCAIGWLFTTRVKPVDMAVGIQHMRKMPKFAPPLQRFYRHCDYPRASALLTFLGDMQTMHDAPSLPAEKDSPQKLRERMENFAKQKQIALPAS